MNSDPPPPLQGGSLFGRGGMMPLLGNRTDERRRKEEEEEEVPRQTQNLCTSFPRRWRDCPKTERRGEKEIQEQNFGKSQKHFGKSTISEKIVPEIPNFNYNDASSRKIPYNCGTNNYFCPYRPSFR